ATTGATGAASSPLNPPRPTSTASPARAETRNSSPDRHPSNRKECYHYTEASESCYSIFRPQKITVIFSSKGHSSFRFRNELDLFSLREKNGTRFSPLLSPNNMRPKKKRTQHQSISAEKKQYNR